MDNKDKQTKKTDLATLVNKFSNLFFILGRCPEDDGQLRGAVNEYINVRNNYCGDTSVYDKEVNGVIKTNPRLCIPII